MRATTKMPGFEGLAAHRKRGEVVINSKLLCEFIINPFGDDHKIRELLVQIEGRALSDAELERGRFCVEIAFYFVAWLAIKANVTDASLQTTLLYQLHQRLRAFHAGEDLPVSLAWLIASPSERDQVDAALRRQAGEPQPADGASASATKAALFDLLAVRRLCEYRAAIGRPHSRDQFYVLAEQVLLHFGGRKYDPITVAILAGRLSTNYNIASEIVSSGAEAISTHRRERDSPFQPLQFDSGMPDLTGRQPSRIYSAGRYVLLLFEDVLPIARTARLKFKYVLALYEKQERLPACFVTLEDSSSIANVLCVFEGSGAHSNYGSLHSHDLLREFMGRGVILLRDRFELGEIEAHSPRIHPHRQRWWKFFATAAQGRSHTAPQRRDRAA
jgi:hypothetical protein